MKNYKLSDKWVKLSFIYKATHNTLDEHAEQWQIDKMMEDAEIVITNEYVLRDEVRGLKEAADSAKDTLERGDIVLLCMYGEDPTHILMEPEEVESFLAEVGPSSIYTDNGGGNRKEL